MASNPGQKKRKNPTSSNMSPVSSNKGKAKDVSGAKTEERVDEFTMVMYDYAIKKAKADLEEKEEEIKKLKDQLKKTGNTNSAESAYKQTEGMKKRIKELEGLLKQEQLENKVKSDKLAELEETKKKFESQILELTKEYDRLKKLNENDSIRIRELAADKERLGKKDRDKHGPNSARGDMKTVSAKTTDQNEDNKTEELNALKITVPGQMKQIKSLESKIEDLDKEIKELETVKKSLEGKKEELEKLNKELERAKKSQENRIRQLVEENEELKTVKERVQKLESENNKLEKQLVEQTPDKLKEEIETLRTRLSRMAGSQLTDDNQALPNLSDPNRPLSLGEKFSELYDNEWADAMEELMEEDKRKEEEAIKILLDLEAYQFCSEQSEEYLEKINATSKLFVPSSRKELMSKEMAESCKDYRKSMAVHLAGYVQEKFIQKRDTQFPKGSHMDLFVRKSILLCWFMTVQDPMVVIEKKGQKCFNEDLYRPYTKKGKNVAFLVWPPMYLHQNGPLIGKGVAQGK